MTAPLLPERPHRRVLILDVKGERESMLSDDAVLSHVFREDDFNTAKCEMVSLWSGQNGHRSGSQIFAVSLLVVLRVAAKYKIDAYFTVLWCNNVALSLEVNQAGNSLLLFMYLLAT